MTFAFAMQLCFHESLKTEKALGKDVLRQHIFLSPTQRKG